MKLRWQRQDASAVPYVFGWLDRGRSSGIEPTLFRIRPVYTEGPRGGIITTWYLLDVLNNTKVATEFTTLKAAKAAASEILLKGGHHGPTPYLQRKEGR